MTNRGFPYSLRDISIYYRNSYRRYGRSGRRTEGGTLSKEFITLSDFKFYYNYLFTDITDDILKEIEEKLSKRKNELIYWTTEEFAQQNIGFLFYNTFNNNDYNSYDDNIEEKDNSKKAVKIIRLSKISEPQERSIKVEEFCNAKAIINTLFVLHFTPTNYQYQLLCKIKYENLKDYIVLKTWKEAVEYIIINNQLSDIVFDDEYKKDWKQVKEFYDDYIKLFDIQNTSEIKRVEYKIVENNNNLRNSVSVRHIIKVMETRINNINYRVFLFAKFNRYGGATYGIDCINESSKYYNYIDDDKIYYLYESKYFFLESGLNEIVDGKLIVVLDMFYVINDRLRQILGNEGCLITASIYKFFSERYKHLIYDDVDKKIPNQNILILNKYISVLFKGGAINLNGLIITKKKIHIVDQNFCMEFDEEFIDLTNSKILGEIRKLTLNENVRYNFNTLYDKILRLSSLGVIYRDNVTDDCYKDFKQAEFILNDIKIQITKEKRVKINNIFCRIDDIFELLNRVICYSSQEDYEKYIKDVSYIGYKWKALIGTGSQIKLYNPFSEMKTKNIIGDINLRFSYYWDTKKRSRIWLMLNNVKYEITGKLHFIKQFCIPQQYLTIEEIKIKLMECVDGVDDTQIIEIIQNAVKEGEIIKHRAEELVRKTVIDIEAVKGEINIRGVKKIGYLFKGRVSHSEYFVDEHTLDVYKKINGEWNRRCVVNDSNKNRIFEDWLANRLVNVYNEPSFIHTLHNG